MFTILILVIGFYLYRTGELQELFGKMVSRDRMNIGEARKVIDLRYAAGQISEGEYVRLKGL